MFRPKEISIHPPDAQACGGPEQGANCHDTIPMHRWVCKILVGNKTCK